MSRKESLGHTPSSETMLLDAVSGLAPMLSDNAREAEQRRKPVDEVMAAIEGTGVYRYFVPKRFGGLEYSLEGFMHLGMNLGEACLSTAWVVTFCMEHNWLLSLFGQAAQEDIFGQQPYVVAPGSLAPKGKAVEVEGGYRVTGRWQWGTGVMHADWAMVAALTPLPGQKEPALCMFILPIKEVEIIDTWHIDGMIGTGSNDIAIHDVFIPQHRMVNLADVRAGESPGALWHDSPLYKMPMLPVLGLTATAPAVGAAKQAVTLFHERLQGRVVYGTTTKQGDKPVAQSRLAHARAEALSVENQLLHIARDVTAWGVSGETCPELERARLRVEIGHVVKRSRDLVRDVVEACGASAHFLDNPLQSMQRDLNTLSCHTVFDLDLASEIYGRLLLGLPANAPI